jgi:lysyl-tRNA synthetase class I
MLNAERRIHLASSNQHRRSKSSFSIPHSSFSIAMSSPAQVRSTDAIEALRASLLKFQQRVQIAVDVLDGELHRASNWVEHDRPSYWKQQTHDAEDAVHAAKLELERCLMMTVAGQRPTCREQKAALEAAKARRAYCQEKCESVRRWQRNFRHEQFEYDGRIGQLRRAIELDVPKAAALLQSILRRLEEYQIERPPESSIPSEPTAAANHTSSIQHPASKPLAPPGDELPTDSAAPRPPVAALPNPEP